MGLTMAVSGEKEFREAMANINAALKVSTSELSLVTAQYANNKESIEALTAKGETLENQITSQTAKTKLLREQTEKYTAELGENDTKTLKWKAELNKAEAELVNLNNALENNIFALSEAKVALSDNAAAAVTNEAATEKLAVKVDETGKKTSEFNGILGKLSQMTGVQLPMDLSAFSNGADDMSVSVGGAVTTVIGLVVALQKNMMQAAEGVRELKKAADQASISDQQMAALQYAEKITGITTDKMIDAYSKTTEFIKRATEGNAEALAIIDKYNISLEDTNGKLRSADDVFLEIAGKLGDIEDGTERNITAMKFFGEDAKSLYQIFDDGGKNMKGAIAEAWDTGIVKSDEYYAKLSEAAEETARFFAQINSFMQDIAIWWNEFTDDSYGVSETILSAFGPLGSIVGKIVDEESGDKRIGFSWDAIVNDIKSIFGGGDKAVVTAETSPIDKNDERKYREEEKEETEESTEEIVKAIDRASKQEDENARKATIFWAELPAAIESGRGVMLDSYATGTDYVPRTGMYMLHRGEKVIPESQNRVVNNSPIINIYQPVSSPYETARVLKRTMQQLINKI